MGRDGEGAKVMIRSIQRIWHSRFCVPCRAAVRPHFLGLASSVTVTQRDSEWRASNERT